MILWTFWKSTMKCEERRQMVLLHDLSWKYPEYVRQLRSSNYLMALRRCISKTSFVFYISLHSISQSTTKFISGLEYHQYCWVRAVIPDQLKPFRWRWNREWVWLPRSICFHCHESLSRGSGQSIRIKPRLRHSWCQIPVNYPYVSSTSFEQTPY